MATTIEKGQPLVPVPLLPPGPFATTMASTFEYVPGGIPVIGPDEQVFVSGAGGGFWGFVAGQFAGLLATVMVRKVEPPETTRRTVNDVASHGCPDESLCDLHVTTTPEVELPATYVGVPGAEQQNKLLPLPFPHLFPAGIGQSESELQHLANEQSA